MSGKTSTSLYLLLVCFYQILTKIVLYYCMSMIIRNGSSAYDDYNNMACEEVCNCVFTVVVYGSSQ